MTIKPENWKKFKCDEVQGFNYEDESKKMLIFEGFEIRGESKFGMENIFRKWQIVAREDLLLFWERLFEPGDNSYHVPILRQNICVNQRKWDKKYKFTKRDQNRENRSNNAWTARPMLIVFSDCWEAPSPAFVFASMFCKYVFRVCFSQVCCCKYVFRHDLIFLNCLDSNGSTCHSHLIGPVPTLDWFLVFYPVLRVLENVQLWNWEPLCALRARRIYLIHLG